MTALKTPASKAHGWPAIALLVGRLSGGGQSKVQIDLANALARDGHRVDLLYFHSPGPAPRRVCAGVNVVDLRRPCAGRGPWPLLRWAGSRPGSLAVLLWQALTARRPLVRPYPGASRTWLMRSTLGLVQYLERRRPAVLYAAGDGGNLLALTARRISTAESRIVAALHVVPSPRRRSSEGAGRWRALLASRLVCRAIPQADAIVAVSRGVAEEWSRAAHVPRDRITTIYNPVVGRDLPALAQAPPGHPWFEPGAPPVILGAGRLVEQKDYPTLIRAFATVREWRPARLVILGEGEHRGRLEALAANLGLAAHVSFTGFVANPLAYMARAGVFVLSSRWEGLGNVLIEALACGCPVVSTDCPSGPAEILEGGEYGRLVAVGDPAALAAAILATLDDPPLRQRLVARGMQFTAERAARCYAGLIPRTRS